MGSKKKAPITYKELNRKVIPMNYFIGPCNQAQNKRMYIAKQEPEKWFKLGLSGLVRYLFVYLVSIS